MYKRFLQNWEELSSCPEKSDRENRNSENNVRQNIRVLEKQLDAHNLKFGVLVTAVESAELPVVQYRTVMEIIRKQNRDNFFARCTNGKPADCMCSECQLYMEFSLQTDADNANDQLQGWAWTADNLCALLDSERAKLSELLEARSQATNGAGGEVAGSHHARTCRKAGKVDTSISDESLEAKIE
jgi:hypothetical protein